MFPKLVLKVGILFVCSFLFSLREICMRRTLPRLRELHFQAVHFAARPGSVSYEWVGCSGGQQGHSRSGVCPRANFPMSLNNSKLQKGPRDSKGAGRQRHVSVAVLGSPAGI